MVKRFWGFFFFLKNFVIPPGNAFNDMCHSIINFDTVSNWYHNAKRVSTMYFEVIDPISIIMFILDKVLIHPVHLQVFQCVIKVNKNT